MLRKLKEFHQQCKIKNFNIFYIDPSLEDLVQKITADKKKIDPNFEASKITDEIIYEYVE
jgi:hypothetical protein